MHLRAVIFDLGGVVLESPLHFIAEYERDHGLPANLIAGIVGGYAARPDGPWQRLERGELPLLEFCRSFDAEIAAAGYRAETARMMQEMSARSLVRPAMVNAIRQLRERGLKVAALTNNWVMGDDHDARTAPLFAEFDVVVQSCKVGIRKPEPAIYRIALDQLQVPAEAAVFLDDIGGNLKAAKALGIRTIKVREPALALHELGGMVGMSLLTAG